MDPFKAMLLEVSNRLSSADLEQLKFLCQDSIRRKKAEEISSGLQLFECLIQRTDIGPHDTRLLRELLTQIQQQVLLEILDRYETDATRDTGTDPRETEKINIATDVIVEHLGKKWLQYGRKLGISDSRLEDIEVKHPRSLEERAREVIKEWKKIHKEQAITEALIMALRACKQNYTADLVEKTLMNT